MADWIEVLGAPLLLRVVDLITGVYRGRSQEDGSTEAAEADTAQLRQELHALTIDAIALRDKEAEIVGILERVEIHRANLRQFEEQAAKWGDALLPAIVRNNIADEREAIDRELARLIGMLGGLAREDLPEAIKLLEAANR